MTLSEIHLASFGRFNNSRFKLTEANIFTGGNEAGKTTLFDALLTGICRPKGNTETAKALRERYGPASKVSLTDNTGKNLENQLMEESEFINLYAIRAGEMNMKLKNGEKWLKKLMANLFSGGVDPNTVIEVLRYYSGDDKRLEHNRRFSQLGRETADLENSQRSLEKSRNDILTRNSAPLGLSADIKGLKEKLLILDNETAGLDTRINQGKKGLERQRLSETMSALTALESLDQRLNTEFSLYETDRTDEFKTLDARENELNSIKNQVSAQLETLNAGLEKHRARSSEMALERPVLERKKQLAERLLLNADAAEAASAPRRIYRIRYTALAAGILFLAAGITCGILVHPLFYIATAGSLLLLLSRKEITIADRSAVERFLQSAREEWRIRTGGTEMDAVSSPSGLRSLAAKIENALDIHVDTAGKNDLDEKAMKNKLDELTARYRTLSEDLEKTLRDRASLLTLLRVADRDTYIRKLTERRQAVMERDALKARLSALNNDFHDLKADCARRLDSLDQEGINGPVFSDAELQSLEKKRAALALERIQTAARLSTLEKSFIEASAEIRGGLGSLPEEIFQTAVKIERNKELMQEIMLDKKAANIAADILSGLETDAESQFKNMAGEIAAIMKDLLSTDVRVEMKSMENSGFSALDKEGTVRSVEHLSAGTRDTFYFAARLAMALRGEAGLKLLVLDEPFQSMDSAREKQAVRILSEFSRKNGFQIIVFTKEERLAGLFHEVLPQLTEYRL